MTPKGNNPSETPPLADLEYEQHVLATAHKLNNALMAISGRIELLEMSLMVAGPAIQRDLKEMRESADQAARLTTDLLNRAQKRDSGETATGDVTPRESDRANKPRETRERRNQFHILLVDDEPGVRNVLYRFLTNSGYRVTRAQHAAEALAAFGARPRDYHLLLTDVIMPGLSGADLAREIRKASPNIKLVFMSGYTADCLESTDDLGPISFLQKPTPLTATLELLDGLLLAN